MHPVIRVSLFLVFALFISRSDLPRLLIGSLFLLPILILGKAFDWHALYRAVSRIRWFLLSILVLYGWLTPGPPLFGTVWFDGPSLQGLHAGLYQVMSLILMITALVAMIGKLSRETLLGAVYWWSYPLQWLGISREVLVLRLIMVMERVERLQQDISRISTEKREASRLQRLAGITGEVFQLVDQNAQQEASKCVTIQKVLSPPLWQWGYPCLLAGIFLLSRWSENLFQSYW
ncbi:MAG: energy-coupling factor transporter transmembrane protein EcfT [Gammaproteobacteria bacterium]|nr:energy-coupling factor transporter transmembrane protein EcfT [Gammaproteobacteria bacterium]MDH5650808.1 energy-coupling factor transporter transmembrane protein EcfT [Gammaproteobacteria bacterium]